MEKVPVGSQAALSIVQGNLLVSVQADLYDDLLLRIRGDILNRVYSKTVKGVIFDMSAVGVMDTYVFNHLADTGKMVLLLGVEPMFIGFQPGVVSALVDMEVDTTNVRSFRTIEEAIGHLTANLSRDEDYEEDKPLNPDNDGKEREIDEYAPDKREG